MDITQLTPAPAMVLKISGRLDTSTAPSAENTIRGLIGTAESLTLDLTDLEYMSSAGLRIMLMLQKLMNNKGGLVLDNPNEMVVEVFDITGMSEILNIKHS